MTVYLDHAATSPLRAEAFAAMRPWLTETFGNPSGGHAIAREARRAVEEGREIIAAALGCAPGEVIFTAGGTEADNLAVFGVVGAASARGNPGAALCSAIEHHAVLHAVQAVGGETIAVDGEGRLDLDDLAGRADDRTALVSVMLANNEVGTIQDLQQVAAVIADRAPGAVLHTDAVQAAPWLDVAARAAPAQLISVAAHKFGGPQGVGALVARGGITLRPLILGGGQERERRSGTHNVAGIVGMAAALAATVEDRQAAAARAAELRRRLVTTIGSELPGVVETASGADRLPNIAHVRIAGVESEALLVLLDDVGICASGGSSCASGALEPSHVLAAMGVGRDDARSALRLSIGRTTTESDIARGAAAVVDGARRLRSTTPARV